MAYNFGDPVQYATQAELWDVVKSEAPKFLACRVDKVNWASQKGLLTDDEAYLLTEWLVCFQEID